MKKTKILSICLIAIMMLMAICPMISFGANTTVTFEDSELAEKVKSYVEVYYDVEVSLEGKTLTISDISKVTNLTLNSTYAIPNCTSLVGLEKFTSLANLTIASGKFTDLTPLGGLKNLTSIIITGAKVNSIDPILNLSNLELLYLSNNNLTSIKGIEKLTNLKSLDVSNGNFTTDDTVIDKNQINQISDISGVEKLTGLNNFIINNMVVYQPVVVNNGEENVTVDLPNLFIQARTKGSMVYTPTALKVENGTLSDDEKKVTMKVSDLKEGKVKVTIEGNEQSTKSAKNSFVKFTYKEAFEIVSVNKKPDTENADKVTVTIEVNKELDPNKIPSGWTLGEDGKSVSKVFDKNATENVVLTDKEGNTLTQKIEVSNVKEEQQEEFKVINKTEEEQDNGKVKVTITVNKELDPNKIPTGWTLGEDGKSIWKVMDKGTTQEITLVAKDGSTIKYKVVVGGDNTTADTDIPQTGITNILIVIIGAIAIVGTVVFVRTRKMLK